MHRFYFLTAFLVLLTADLTAQNKSADSTDMQQIRLNEVIIQSFKQNRDLRLEPVSASVMTGTQINNRNISGIKEISALIPNLYMPDYGSKLTSPVYIRGIGSKINSPSVGLYVDGAPYFDKAAFDFDFSEIDRIEVLRGPQGTLYGRNTMGGIIHVYTKSPLKYQGTSVRLSNANYGSRQYALSRYQTVNEKIGYAVSGNYTHNDGYFTNVYTENKVDKLNSASAMIKLEWKPVQELTIRLGSNFDYLKQGGYPYAVCDSITLKPGKIDYNDYSFYKRNMSTTGLSVQYAGKGFIINSQTAYQYLKDHQGVDQDFSNASVYYATQKQKQHMFSEELNIKSNTDHNYKWLFGAFLFKQKFDNQVILDYLKAGYNTRKLYHNPTFGFALYHQSVIDRLFIKGLTLTIGLRYDYERATTRFINYKEKESESELTDQSDSKLNFSQLLPKIALQYLFPSSAQIYATITKGYKTGGFNSSFETAEDHVFRPESSWNYELGAKHPFLDNRLQAEICFFWIDWKNQQISQSLPSGRGYMLKNAGRSESKGIEITLQANPVNGLLFQLNYGFTDARFKDYTDLKKEELIVYTGNYLPLVPRQTMSAGADYSIAAPCSFIDRVTCSVNYSRTGRIRWRDDNRVSEAGYGLLNAKITAVKDFFTCSLWAKNLTNSRYIAYYFETGGKGLAQRGRPLTFGGNIQLNF